MKYSKEWLSKDEIKKLFSCPKIKTRDLLLIRVAYYGGLRISEVLDSRREDYRTDEYCYLLIKEQKTDKLNWESQPLPASIYADVVRYCNDNNIKTQDYVFQSNRKQELSYIRAYKMVKEICSKCGIIKPITTHTFRRSRATHLKNNGMSLNNVMLFLRHKRIETTIIYLKISKKELADELAKIDKKLLFEEI